MFYYRKTYTLISNLVRKPGFCIRCRSGMHVIPTLARSEWSCKCTEVADQRLYLRGWFREDGLRGQNLNMVLTIITIKAIIQYHFSINNFQIIRLYLMDHLTLFRHIKSPRSVSASWFRFGHSYIHPKFLTHCLKDRKESILLNGRAQVCLIERKGRAHLRGARSLERGALKFAWLIEMSAPRKWHLFTIENLLIQHTVSRWCSSGCVHEGCGGVDHWLQTGDWGLPGFLL